MIRIGIVGCGRILAAHLRGYRLLREAGVEGFRIAALCARREEDALNATCPPRRRPAAAARLSSDSGRATRWRSATSTSATFKPDLAAPRVFTDYERNDPFRREVDAVNDFTPHDLHHQVAAVGPGRSQST